jgi:hypothetical protein
MTVTCRFHLALRGETPLIDLATPKRLSLRIVHTCVMSPQSWLGIFGTLVAYVIAPGEEYRLHNVGRAFRASPNPRNIHLDAALMGNTHANWPWSLSCLLSCMDCSRCWNVLHCTALGEAVNHSSRRSGHPWKTHCRCTICASASKEDSKVKLSVAGVATSC